MFADRMASRAIGLDDDATLVNRITVVLSLATETKKATANTSEVAPTLKSCIMAIPALSKQILRMLSAIWHLALLVCWESRHACT
jgi:hypothetical protein